MEAAMHFVARSALVALVFALGACSDVAPAGVDDAQPRASDAKERDKSPSDERGVAETKTGDPAPAAGDETPGGGDPPAPAPPAISSCAGTNMQPVFNPTSATETWDAAVYTSIKQKGFGCVRFVLFWDDFEPTAGKWNEKAFTVLKTGFDRANAAGLKVIVDAVHLIGNPEGQARVPAWARVADGMAAVAGKGLNYLGQLATRFGTHPALGAWDPVNEPFRYPINATTLGSVLADYTNIIDAIRAKDAKTPIMLEPTGGMARIAAAQFKSLAPKSKENLIWSIHDYYGGGAGNGFTAAGGTVDGYGTADGTTGYNNNTQTRKDMADHLQISIDMAKTQGMTVWIGEFGIGAAAKGHDAFITDKIALYKAKGVGYAWWEYYANDGVFSMVTGEGGAWKPWVEKLR